MLPVIWAIGLGVATYLTSETVSKNSDKKKRQAMQSRHTSKVRRLENRINKLKTELKKYDVEIEAAKAITNKNIKKIEDMLSALKQMESNLTNNGSAIGPIMHNHFRRAEERKKLQEQYDEQIAELETVIGSLEAQVKAAKEKNKIVQKEANNSHENTQKLKTAYRTKVNVRKRGKKV
ncbi:hypothetical protein MIR95_02920 [Vibrio parahaemolyticus]|uniref:hypothetical protein n=1 Tax=Vibrio parahaemolyticus TaxID=670 RepID=UPI000418F2A7|nr:hypothetical protein [Vibrio parahaemolyticus]HCZ9271370.1 hypothetical protein [Vibrio alginolyticus]MCG7758435.1 hypothetical protein [Vibrio parahaemolyticus]HCD1303463.1 hypothetical protein [Vibrio parahaemolyticus]HCE2312039.1 hypothetical protein [Vibrio parahaemolyticus]HCE4679326.1 hypothetical protein [Vibrio parahaemolyticus]